MWSHTWTDSEPSVKIHSNTSCSDQWADESGLIHADDATGAVSNMTIQDEYIDGEATPGDPNDYERRHDLALYYYSNGQLWRAQWSTWAVDENGDPDWLSQRDDGGVREFRYDDPRARYVTADYAFMWDEYPPDANNPLDLQYPVALTDYLGASPTGDAELSRTGAEDDYSFPVDVYTNYFLGLYGQQDAGSGEPTYYHGDLIGSTLATSDDAQELVRVVAYTAFGEVVELTGAPDPNDANATIWSAVVGGELPDGFPRYAYAGQHGYESGLLSRTGANPSLPPVTLQHLGWRWYDPAIGRFVQRDPIGIAGGMNVYGYVSGSPSHRIDPNGTSWRDWGVWKSRWWPWNWSRKAQIGVGGAVVGGAVTSGVYECVLNKGAAVGAAFGTQTLLKRQVMDDIISNDSRPGTTYHLPGPFMRTSKICTCVYTPLSNGRVEVQYTTTDGETITFDFNNR